MFSAVNESDVKRHARCGVCFYATWAPFTKQLFKSLEKIEKEFNLPIVTVDVDSFKSLIKVHSVGLAPTFIVINDNAEVGRIEGSVLLSALRTFVREKLSDI